MTDANDSSRIPRMNHAAINNAMTTTAINTQRVVAPPVEFEVSERITLSDDSDFTYRPPAREKLALERLDESARCSCC
jgi:hypothetical protein